MGDPLLAGETVEAAVAALEEQSDVLVRADHPDGTPRWLTMVPDGVRWLAVAEGREHVQSRDGTVSTLRHYEAVEVVDREDAPAAVQRAVGGWFGMAAGGGGSAPGHGDGA